MHKHYTKEGFTIVELLIVIVVIAILAAVTIVAYNGITENSVRSTMKSDLQSAAQALEVYNVDHSDYPSGLTEAGISASGDNEFTYSQGDGTFCISVANPRTSVVFKIESNQSIAEGACAGNIVESVTDGSEYKLAIAANTSGTVFFSTSGGIQQITADGTQSAFSAHGGGSQAIALSASGVVYALVGQGTGDVRITRITSDGAGTTFFAFTDSGFTGSIPNGIAVGTDGSVFVSFTQGRHFIIKITPDGSSWTIFAGSTEFGDVDGQGAAARFYGLSDLAIDDSNTLYAVDEYNNKIRKITPDGTVSTLAGSGASASGFADGPGAQAEFSYPRYFTLLNNQTLIVSDPGNARLRSINTATGVTSTIAGPWEQGTLDGPLSQARFTYPHFITRGTNKIFYVNDSSTIRKITL